MTCSRFATFIDVNTLTIERSESGLAIADRFVVFRATGTLTARDTVARVNASFGVAIASQGGSTIGVGDTFDFVATNIGIRWVSLVARGTGAKRFVIDSLTRCFFRAKSKFAGIFAFVSSRQWIKDTSQVIGAECIIETLIGVRAAFGGIPHRSWRTYAFEASRFVFAHHFCRAHISILTLVNVLASLRGADESFAAFASAVITRFAFTTIIFHVASRSAKFIDADFTLQTVLI